MKRKGFVAASLLLLALFTGCGNTTENIDDFGKAENVKDVNQNGENDVANEENGEIQSNAQHIKETISENGIYPVEIDADVITAASDNITVFELNNKELDDADLKNLADSLFGVGAYEVNLPYEYWETADLEKERDSFEKMAAEANTNNRFIPAAVWGEVLACLDFPKDSEVKLEDGKIILEEDKSSMGVTIKNARIRGKIKDKTYVLSYTAYFRNEEVLYRALMLVPMFPVTVCDLVYDLNDSEMLASYGENMSNLDSSREMAQEMIKQLGYEDFEEEHVSGRACTDAENQIINLDGYQFYFTRKVNDQQIAMIANEYSYSASLMQSGEVDISEPEYVRVVVDSSGIIGMDIHGLYELGNELSNQVNLLTIDQVQDSVKNFIEGMTRENKNSPAFSQAIGCTVKKIKFTYMPVWCDTQFVLAPVWIYMYEDTKQIRSKDTALLAVNALDGEIIVFSSGINVNQLEIN